MAGSPRTGIWRTTWRSCARRAWWGSEQVSGPNATPVGAALCRERAAKRPRDFSVEADIAGAASRPFRDTRPLLQVRRKAVLLCRTPAAD
ncbi:hypothetical protein DMX06_22720 [Pseudomonas mosselii]|nr:hypothetical protein DMX06_22720 [Pseudomonas mosselii]